MRTILEHMVRGALLCLLAAVFAGCASYNRQASAYYGELVQGDYAEASQKLDKTRLLKKKRNRLLYLLEKGKTEHLCGHYAESNGYFNEADALMERYPAGLLQAVKGSVVNPMMTMYTGEAFEKYMVHYYKALNYLQLGMAEDALVEARRISLRTYAQEDKGGKKDKYAADPFALVLQGMIYERSGDHNDAFISYRNAAEVYLKNDSSFYGVPMPEQLKYDLVRSARRSGFFGEADTYAQSFGIDAVDTVSGNGELVIFWENGRAPVKTEQNIFLEPTRAGGHLHFINGAYGIDIPFHASMGDMNDPKWVVMSSFRVALPRYQPQPLPWQTALASVGGRQVTLQPVHNINALAVEVLRERWLREASLAVSRVVVKKLAQAAVAPGENKDNETKKEEKERAARQVASLAVGAFQFASEKADTRNWQSLPHSIYYARIPLQPGMNTVEIVLHGANGRELRQQVVVDNKGGMQFRNLCTLD
jgi:uncharacterized protein